MLEFVKMEKGEIDFLRSCLFDDFIDMEKK